MGSESKLQSKILSYLKKEGYWTVKTIVCNRSGIMDIIACAPGGRFVGIEVKFGKNKASKLQEYNVNEVNKRGGLAIVVWSLEELVECLKLV